MELTKMLEMAAGRKLAPIVALVVAALFTGAVGATDYYVDAENGNDDWDGTSATRGEGDVGPKETLVGAMAISGLASGDIVHAAEGYYTNRTKNVSSAPYRVSVPAGVTLIADGRADATFIVGAEAPADAADRDKYGNGTGAIRCAYLYGDSKLVGFTVTGGRTPIGGNAGGVLGASSSYVMDCIVSNNVANNRAGAINTGGHVLRCLLTKNRAVSRVGHSVCSGKVYNCVCLDSFDSYCLYQTTAYNCTFAGTEGSSIRYGSAYNCICLKSDGGGNSFYNCYYVDKSDNTTTNETCVLTTAGKLALDTDYRPKIDSIAIDAGNGTLYPSTPAAIASELEKDFHESPRKIGAIDVGACEFDWRTMPASSGLEFSIETVEGGEKLRVWRNFTSDRLVTGFTYAGETVMFDDLAGGVWETTVVGSAVANSLRPIYAASRTDWYVNPDPAKGDDSNKGYHPDCPRRTLKAAMALAGRYHTVHAAPGRYEEGVCTNGTDLYRVAVPDHVSLVASGRADETFIMGAAATADAPDRDAYGNGTNSIRCASLGAHAKLVGFTVTGGRTPIGGHGGGVAGPTTAFVIGCILTNNVAQQRGGAIYSGPKAIRCLFRGNVAYRTNIGHSVAGSSVYNCVFAGAGDSYHVYMASIYSCTFMGGATACRDCNVYNSILIGGDSGKNKFYRCLLAGSLNTSADQSFANDGTLVDVPSSQRALDESYRPVTGNVAIDAGNAEYWTLPDDVSAEAKLDFAKGQRIYNGAVDIGAGEYDWRGVFGAKLHPGSARAQVTAASENVTTNALDGIVLTGGDSLEVSYSVRELASRICTFRAEVTGEGTVTARFGDEILVPDEAGLYTYTPAVGENLVSISFEGEGSAVVSGFAGPHVGGRFVIR